MMIYEHVITDAKSGVVTNVPFTQAEIDSYVLSSIPKVPSVVSMKQARLALNTAGLLASVDTHLSTKGTVEEQIEWEYATSVDRNSPIVNSLIGTMGFTSEQVDFLFLLAASYS